MQKIGDTSKQRYNSAPKNMLYFENHVKHYVVGDASSDFPVPYDFVCTAI